LPAAKPPEPVTVYKWQDENGVWQFSNDPVDVEGVARAEAVELDGRITIVESVNVEAVHGPAKPPALPSLPAGVTSIAPGQVQEMMEAVGDMQETVDARKADIDRASGRP
jgi:hypothetical protein